MCFSVTAKEEHSVTEETKIKRVNREDEGNSNTLFVGSGNIKNVDGSDGSIENVDGGNIENIDGSDGVLADLEGVGTALEMSRAVLVFGRAVSEMLGKWWYTDGSDTNIERQDEGTIG